MNTKSKIILLVISAVSLFVLIIPAMSAAEKSIGMVISVQGQAMAINQENNKRAIQRRSDIYLNEKIITQEDSKVQIRLKDESIIVVQPSSEFYVSEFSFNKSAPRQNRYVGNIAKGALINISGQGKSENYQLQSPLAAISFRGTGVATKLIAGKVTPIRQDVYVFQGYVEFANKCVPGICESQKVNIGIGQKNNAATVDAVGKIKSFESSDLSSGELAVSKALVNQGEGKASVQCKVRR